jgi:hypothetical protein
MNQIKNPFFFIGGNAIFTVSNPSGIHYTYKIRKPSEEMPFFVSLLSGPDNENNFNYLGIYDPNKGTIRLTKKSRYKEDSLPVKVIRWAIAIINKNLPIPEGYAIQHEGRCCKCGRTLTTPESIELGIGPICMGII